jgi:fibronectin type 3 domain-containing protein
VTDSNLIRLAARDQTSQPAPGSVGATLSVSPVNAAHARLRWASIPTAAVYRVYRAQLPQGPFSKIAEITGTTFDDANAFSNSASFYYSVRAADSCGNEGP